MYAEFIVPEENEYMNTKKYLTYKTKVLYQLGLTDHESVKAYLKGKCEGAETELKAKIQIDNAARTIMMAYYDGDRTFTLAKKQKSFLADAM